MAKYQVSIEADVRAVLERAEISSDSVRLPGDRLDRGLYERVNKVLVAAGGKWNRKAGVHLFPSDPRAVLGLALDAGAITDSKKANQQFFTPDDLADRLVAAAAVEAGSVVLEPSAGGGSIARAASRRGATVLCIERDPALASALLADGWPVLNADFLETDLSFGIRPDRVVMNPPFTDGQDIEHVTHALHLLSERGKLAAIMSAGVLSSTLRRAVEFRDRVRVENGRFDEIEAGAFLESGTGVRTVLLSIDRQTESSRSSA